VTQRVELVSDTERTKPAETAPRDVFQEDALDRVAFAEPEDLLEVWLERISHQHDPHMRSPACVGARRRAQDRSPGTR
jgi:hypothetical protein